jgi:hypothetical protein
MNPSATKSFATINIGLSALNQLDVIRHQLRDDPTRYSEQSTGLSAARSEQQSKYFRCNKTRFEEKNAFEKYYFILVT